MEPIQIIYTISLILLLLFISSDVISRVISKLKTIKIDKQHIQSIIYDQILKKIDVIVNSTNQTIVSDLKEKTDNGKLPKATAADILSSVVKEVISNLSEDETKTILNVFSNPNLSLNEIVTEMVESSVCKNHSVILRASEIETIKSSIDTSEDDTIDIFESP